MERKLIDRKSITLTKGQVHSEIFDKNLYTGNVSFLFEHSFNGYHRRVLLDVGEKGQIQKHRSIVLRGGMQKETLNDWESLNSEHFDFQKIELSTDEPELIIAFSVLLETGIGTDL